MLDIGFYQTSRDARAALVFICFEDQLLSEEAQAFDQSHRGFLKRALDINRFKGKKSEVLMVTPPLDIAASRIVLLGLGKSEHLTIEILHHAGGSLVKSLRPTPDAAVEIHAGSVRTRSFTASDIAAHMAFGAQLRHWRFDQYRTKEEADKKPSLQSLGVLLPEADSARQACTAYEPLEQVAHGVCLARSLISEPPNVLYPASYAERLLDLKGLNVTVEILGQKELEALGMNALLGVAQGSIREPKVVVLQWMGASQDQKPLVFVGKGVTFDTGGISLKPSSGMGDMKYDMGGSAIVAGLIRALAGRKAKVNVVGILGLVENMPSGSAQRPGDVVKSMSGQTIEIMDTDAEGRLVLADALWYAQDRFKPELIVDLATLTGAITLTFGNHYAGLFSNNDSLCARLTKAGETIGERLWRLPLGEQYDRDINSDIADVKNLGPRGKGGSITAAQFLLRFVNNFPWAHLDIAGVTWSEKELPTADKGATGYGVQLLNQFVLEYHETRD